MVKVRSRFLNHSPSYLHLDLRPTAWKSPKRNQTILKTPPWRPKRSCPFSTVSFLLSILLFCIAHLLPRTQEEAFAAKHMPDLGHDVKEFQVSHWKLQNWKKLEKKLTGPEFDCGGHKWYVFLVYRSFILLRNLRTSSGGYFSSPSEILTLLLMILSLFISITPTPRARRRAGTLAPNSHWSSPILTIPPSIPSAVRSPRLISIPFHF